MTQSDHEQFDSPDEWETYLEVFLEESDEDLESLTQALLRLEENPGDRESLNEAFRLLHTHKGSAGLMGFDGISELAHQLENRFEKVRSGDLELTSRQITVVLKCVDFLKEFNASLRSGDQPNQDTNPLISQLAALEEQEDTSSKIDDAFGDQAELPSVPGGCQVYIEFEDGLQLADMKSRLIVARLSNIGEIVATIPAVDEIQSVDDLSHFALLLMTDKDREEIEEIANVDGVKTVRLIGTPETDITAELSREELTTEKKSDEMPTEEEVDSADESETSSDSANLLNLESAEEERENHAELSEEPEPEIGKQPTEESTVSNVKSVTESIRVGVDRLDKLMNLTGELVVTQSRLQELVNEAGTLFRPATGVSQLESWNDQVQADLNRLKQHLSENESSNRMGLRFLSRIERGLELAEGQVSSWTTARRKLGQVMETADLLDRVAGSLQQSVLDTRMVAVAPLFNRFRRVIRDLADDRNKQVKLQIHGEKTELDKRMIDELGDPLLHLIRNSVDHGLETTEQRRKAGKAETGTINLNASHQGNHVYISIQDDGRGLDFEKIKRRVVEMELATESDLDQMSEKELVKFIWRPGFSTSQKVTDISGRGVGMDVVRQRISELNGVVEVESVPDKGTEFRIRLPLTLAIIKSLLVRFGSVKMSIPISDVLETAVIEPKQIQIVYGRETIDLRGKIVPLIRLDHVFSWPSLKDTAQELLHEVDRPDTIVPIRVVIIKDGVHTIGLVIDEFIGSSDIVIKSLAENFVTVRGLAGASILGDGSVCLMLDSSEVIKMSAVPDGKMV